MTQGLVWLAALIVVYWAYCIYWGMASARMADSATEYYLADRGIAPWVFVLSVTAASFTGWVLLGHSGFVFAGGFQFSQLSLCAVVIPLTGVMFFKRQWLLGKRFGYVTPGDMFADYFNSEAIKLLVVLVALVFSIPFLGMQLIASGYLVNILSDGLVDRDFAMWALTGMLFLYVCFGGLRAVAYVGTLQALLLVAGLLTIGLIVYGKLGGFTGFTAALAGLGATDIGPFGATAEGYNAYLEIPGVIQFTAGLGREAPVGGVWTASMILTYALSLMGIQAAPAFTMWAFAARSPKGFAPQQVWASAAAVGLLLVFALVILGMGAHFLGASPAVSEAGLAISGWLPALAEGDPTTLLAHYIRKIGEQDPWLIGLLAVCVLAAIQAMVAAYASTSGSMLARDLYQRYIAPDADDRQRKLHARVCLFFVLLVALLTATYTPQVEAELGSLALAFGFQLWPALAAVCWFPWLTREGVLVGLVAGLAAVVFTEPFGNSIAEFFGFQMPWGRWPWTIHSAGWGIFVNVVLCLCVSAATRGGPARAHRGRFHAFLDETAGMARERRVLRPTAWALALGWFFFAVGPGAVIGNDLFGEPNGGLAAWHLGMPSIWAWQILWWAIGVLMIWFLAYKMGMSTSLPGGGDYQIMGRPLPRPPMAPTVDWRWWFWAAVAVVAAVTAAHWIFG